MKDVLKYQNVSFPPYLSFPLFVVVVVVVWPDAQNHIKIYVLFCIFYFFYYYY